MVVAARGVGKGSELLSLVLELGVAGGEVWGGMVGRGREVLSLLELGGRFGGVW